MSDTLDVLDLEGVRTGQETAVGGFDLIWNSGVVAETEQSSFLGCLNHGGKPLRDIIKRVHMKIFSQ